MKFRLLLWVLGLMMGKASRTNPAFQQQLGDKDLAFQLQTLDGKVARHFIVKDQRITSRSGVHPAPAFAIAFKGRRLWLRHDAGEEQATGVHDGDSGQVDPDQGQPRRW